ncbi:MAG: hypothetical protein NT098_05050 [Candidatus Parcubacteria bacterium]|nr:hypothetical protein [Candidatus Parcubacteria bacterium]
MNLAEKMPNFELAPKKNEHPKGREYHLRLDDMTGMRNKELLYLPEGIAYLHEKFGDEMELVLGDIAGMGVGNEMLRRPDEDASSARKNVDDCFSLLNATAEEIFGKDIRERPFEIVRVGGDEIIFITRKGDTRLHDFFERFNQQKEEFLVEERIGREAYDVAKLETNVKAQMKLITKDPEYLEMERKGDLGAIDAWLHSQLGDVDVSEKRTGDLLKKVARKRLNSIPEKDWLLPLDFYHSPAKEIRLRENTDQSLSGVMYGLAEADADIAWAKGHPGMKISENIARDDLEIQKTADKYLEQAKGVEKNVRLMQGKERELSFAREQGEELLEERLKKEIIRLETVDPGTGAIRLDKSGDKYLNDLIEMTNGVSDVEITRLDVPYFGVFNNHYDYATADEMMKKLASAYRRFMNAVIVRDGGNLFAVCEEGGNMNKTSGLENALDGIISEYANPTDLQKKSAMENEAMIKKAITRQEDPFGQVKLFPTVKVAVSEKTKLSDVVRRVL